MVNQRVSFYARLRSEDDARRLHPAHEPLQHNLDVKKLRRRCVVCLCAAMFIAFVLYLMDIPAGHDGIRTPENTNTQLVGLVVLHRHGKGDISWEGKEEEGELLDVGFTGGFKLGRSLKQQYWHNLTASGGVSVKSVSTDVHRTIDTAHSVLLGWHTDAEPGDGNCSCRAEAQSPATTDCAAACIGVDWPSGIPQTEIWNSTDKKEAILRQCDVCEGFDDHKRSLAETDEYKNATGRFADQLDYVKKQIIESSEVCLKGDPKKSCNEITVEEVSNICDTLECLRAQGVSDVGPYTNVNEAYEKLKPVRTWLWHLEFSNDIGPSIGGILLGQIIKDLEAGLRRGSTKNLRSGTATVTVEGSHLFLYSAHDSTLASLLAGMEVSDWDFPEFTSHIAFELYGPQQPTPKSPLAQHYVRIQYNEKPLTVGKCDQPFCQLTVFIESMEKRHRTQSIDDCKPPR